MNAWIIPSNPKDYDIHKGLMRYGNELEWTKTLATTNIATGDIVYIYITAPRKAITMKFTVTNQNVVSPKQKHNDNGEETAGAWFVIKFLEDISPITYETLLNNGVVNGYIQTARLLKSEQEAALARLTL